MKTLIATTAMLLMAPPAFSSAQDGDHQSRGLGYVFVGAGTHTMGLTTGFGVEGYVYKGLGMGVEVGTAGLGASANGNPNWIGLGSADASYHFFPKKIGKNIFDESWIKGAQSSPIQGSEGADDHETHDYH